jgi:hypothetical protein
VSRLGHEWTMHPINPHANRSRLVVIGGCRRP